VSGFLAGVLGGLFGLGGASMLIPLFIFFFGYSQHQAQGTALAALLPPVGILAVLRYYYGGNVVIDVAIYAGIGFLVGGLVGAMIAHPIPDLILKRLFAAYLIILGIRMLF
jgi:uncharacterized protein